MYPTQILRWIATPQTTPETPAPRKWSLVPTNGGAELYFGEGYSEDGVTAGIFQAECRGESLDAYSESRRLAAPSLNLSPKSTSTITINAVGSVPAAGLSLSLDVDYPYRGLLSVTLTSPLVPRSRSKIAIFAIAPQMSRSMTTRLVGLRDKAFRVIGRSR
ncbi:MAG: hypothetical protein CM15mP74_16960 [Halieaceae bacterium]|nr:MAG: hypothetical protein CM15mP74_16960 [Halieaceae bacterium]